MDVEKQREIIRLWNRMRQIEGPVAEEIRSILMDQVLNLPNRLISLKPALPSVADDCAI